MRPCLSPYFVWVQHVLLYAITVRHSLVIQSFYCLETVKSRHHTDVCRLRSQRRTLRSYFHQSGQIGLDSSRINLKVADVKKKWQLRLVWGWTRRWEIQIPDPWTTKYCNTVNLLQAENQFKYLPKKQTKTQAWMRKFLYSWNIYLVFFIMARLIS